MPKIYLPDPTFKGIFATFQDRAKLCNLLSLLNLLGLAATQRFVHRERYPFIVIPRNAVTVVRQPNRKGRKR